MSEHETAGGEARDTRRRLMEAAERLFAEKGFGDTSIREIADAAEANVAAVNYHFGGKENIYREVLRERARACAAERAEIFGRVAAREEEGLEPVLRAFVRSHLERYFAPGAPPTDIALFFREISNPGPGFDVILEEMILPTRDLLCSFFQRAVPGLTRERAMLSMASVMGQVIHFVRARPAISALLGRDYDESLLDEIVEHIVRFSVGGMEAA